MSFAANPSDVHSLAICHALPQRAGSLNYHTLLFTLGLIFLCVRIDNSSSLETQAWERESNPNPGSPQAARPVYRRTACLCILGINPPQADTENVSPCNETGQTKEIIAPNGILITAPNGGTEAATISFMNLMSTPVANQEPSQERGTGLRPSPMITALKQDNQVAKMRLLTNERTPGPSAILLPLDPSIQSHQACLSQCPDEPPMENIKFGGGVLYRPKDPTLKPYCHFLIKVMLIWLIQLLPYFVFAIYQFSSRSPGPPDPPPLFSVLLVYPLDPFTLLTTL
ncbi:hypothetical protein DSO57_1023873 [Entomophthora muscae]|uniref:Uncharacterized protein n=1 Tax=Entomophthora muscae TaxID=34485 RepID=A0ACC2TPZ8_9FUNG|nr:hypothetical protein DSO57_1023873 [Entomophthora muscae]